jgi:hypothetical protein
MLAVLVPEQTAGSRIAEPDRSFRAGDLFAFLACLRKTIAIACLRLFTFLPLPLWVYYAVEAMRGKAMNERAQNSSDLESPAGTHWMHGNDRPRPVSAGRGCAGDFRFGPISRHETHYERKRQSQVVGKAEADEKF